MIGHILLKVFDIDNDGDIDLSVGNSGDFGVNSYFLINDGTGKFIRVEFSEFFSHGDNSHYSRALFEYMVRYR